MYYYARIIWQVVLLMGTLIVFAFDAVMVPRKVKAVMCVLWSLNAAYQIYQIIFKHSAAGWVIPIEVCIGVECIDSWSLYTDNLLTVFLFSSKYAISLILNPEALIILKSAVLRENKDEMTWNFNLVSLYTFLESTCCPTASVAAAASAPSAPSDGNSSERVAGSQ